MKEVIHEKAYCINIIDSSIDGIHDSERLWEQ